MSRFSIDTTQPGWACYAAWTLEVIREIADRVNRFFLAPIYVHNSRSCASAARIHMHCKTTIHSKFAQTAYLIPYYSYTGEVVKASSSSCTYIP